MTLELPADLRPRILVGHVLEQLRQLPDACVHTVVTSPPYWGLRTYGTTGQVWGGDPAHAHDWALTAPRRGKWGKFAGGTLRGNGLEACEVGSGESCSCGAWRGELGSENDPDLFVAHLADVFEEIRRVLRPDGSAWLNLGDTYNAASPVRVNAGKKWQRATDPDYVRFEDQKTRPSRAARGLKPKDLVGIPWRVAFELQRRGWYLRAEAIWSKPNPMPESVRDRPTRSHEQVFLLTRRSKYYWDADAASTPVVESVAERAEAAVAGLRPSTIREVLDGYTGEATKDYASAGAQDPSAVKARIIAGKRARLEAGETLQANLRSVWTIPTQPYRGAHFATFPEALVDTCLRATAPRWGTCATCGTPWRRRIHRTGGTTGNDWHPVKGTARGRVRNASDSLRERSTDGTYERSYSEAGPTCGHAGPTAPPLVLDPFAGSGTVLEVARSRGCRSIGIELKPEYAELARKRAGPYDLAEFAEVA